MPAQDQNSIDSLPRLENRDTFSTMSGGDCFEIPSEDRNQYIHLEDTVHGESVSFSCRAGSRLLGPATAKASTYLVVDPLASWNGRDTTLDPTFAARAAANAVADPAYRRAVDEAGGSSLSDHQELVSEGLRVSFTRNVTKLFQDFVDRAKGEEVASEWFRDGTSLVVPRSGLDVGAELARQGNDRRLKKLTDPGRVRGWRPWLTSGDAPHWWQEVFTGQLSLLLDEDFERRKKEIHGVEGGGEA